MALTGEAAETHARHLSRLMERLRQQLNTPLEEMPHRLEQLLEERRAMERDLKAVRRGGQGDDAASLLKTATETNGITVLAEQVEAGSMEELRGLADELRRRMTRGVAVIGAVIGGKASLLCVVSDDLVREEVKAGEIVNEVAKVADGRGGGPPHMATAGAKDAAKLPGPPHAPDRGNRRKAESDFGAPAL